MPPRFGPDNPRAHLLHEKETTVPAQSYDIITIGGGIAASALAKAMAERGAKQKGEGRLP